MSAAAPADPTGQALSANATGKALPAGQWRYLRLDERFVAGAPAR